MKFRRRRLCPSPCRLCILAPSAFRAQECPTFRPSSQRLAIVDNNILETVGRLVSPSVVKVSTDMFTVNLVIFTD